jgi:hypothetical protein
MREDGRTPGRLETAEAPYEGISSMVMMSWEQGYMRELVKALGIRGDDDVSGHYGGRAAIQVVSYSPG